jgi:DNA adenine methylase
MAQAPRRTSPAAGGVARARRRLRPAEAQPFLKWVGGKAQLLAQFDRLFPARIERYVEPFVGGGAVFFHLKRRFPRMRALLRDNNAELINAYVVVRDLAGELMRRLDEHHARFLADREGYYYEVRAQRLEAAAAVERAARMIFLNKSCFNGLWRVNGGGHFNVPIGWQPNLRLYDRENLLAASAALEDADLAVQDFRATFAEMGAGNFAYIDPPYVPVSATARFTSYTKEDFGSREQEELAAQFATAAGRGVRLMLSNSDTPRVRELYHAFTLLPISARRAINRDGAKRGVVGEVAVVAG